MEEQGVRTALVTGSSRGIGAAIARGLAATGMRVMVHYHTDAAAARATLATLPGEGHGLAQADVADAEQIRRLMDQTIGCLGRLDVLVNNAGIYEMQPFDLAAYEDWQAAWRRTLDTNLMSAANASYCALSQMREQGGGKIINVASRAAFRGETDAPAYAVSKSGMVALTRCLARALARERILAYCIAPGWVETAMSRESIKTALPEILRDIPLGRMASVEDVAGVAVFLASSAADYLTGITIDVNGASYLH